MSFEHKTPPIKLNLDEGFYNLMLEVLTQNENIELDDTNIGAKRLKDKLLKYPRTYKGEDDKNLVSIGFFPREASEMINQLLVWLAVNTDVNYKIGYYSQIAENNQNKKAKEE